MPNSLRTIDLGHMPYAQAYELQLRHVAEVQVARESLSTPAAGEVGRLLLVEHDPPVVTISRRKGAADHLLASQSTLATMGIELCETDRGGDITYHGPGQLVVYPILDLNLLGLSLHAYMRFLEQVVIDTVGTFGVQAHRDACATGVWVGGETGSHTDEPSRGLRGADTQTHEPPRTPQAPQSPAGSGPLPYGRGSDGECEPVHRGAKLCAMGVRVKRWVSMHGLALNVTTNLDHFGLIVPCGLAGRPVASMERLMGVDCPKMEGVKRALVGQFEDGVASLAQSQKSRIA